VQRMKLTKIPFPENGRCNMESILPCGRFNTSSCVYKNGLFIFGGTQRSYDELNGFWRFDLLTHTWASIPLENAQGVRNISAVLYKGVLIYARTMALTTSICAPSATDMVKIDMDKYVCTQKLTLQSSESFGPVQCFWSLVLMYQQYLVLVGGSMNYAEKIFMCDCDTLTWKNYPLKSGMLQGSQLNHEYIPGVILGDKVYCFAAKYFSFDFVTQETIVFQLSHPITGCELRFSNKHTKLVNLKGRIFGVGQLSPLSQHMIYQPFLFEFDPIELTVRFIDLDGDLRIGYGFSLHEVEDVNQIVLYGGELSSVGQSDVYIIQVELDLKKIAWNLCVNMKGTDVRMHFD
jgi:hypothetical protein